MVDAEELEAPEPEREKTPADLSLAGAIGPETHEYQTMALHLYMRKVTAAQ